MVYIDYHDVTALIAIFILLSLFPNPLCACVMHWREKYCYRPHLIKRKTFLSLFFFCLSYYFSYLFVSFCLSLVKLDCECTDDVGLCSVADISPPGPHCASQHAEGRNVCAGLYQVPTSLTYRCDKERDVQVTLCCSARHSVPPRNYTAGECTPWEVRGSHFLPR